MATISSPWVGIGRGKMGQGVYYLRRGKIYSRQYVAHVIQPETDGHKRDWGKWRVSQRICNTLKWAVKKYWKTTKDGQTEINALMSYSKRNAAQEVMGVWEPDWEKVRFSSGTLAGFGGGIDVQVVGNTMVFSWGYNPGTGSGNGNDLFAYLGINTSRANDKNIGEAVFGTTTNKRKYGSFSLDITNLGSGDYRVYGCFVSGDERKVSESVYFGEALV